MKPILFSTPMVQAILDGRKTQTRRVAKAPDYAYIKQGGLVWYDPMQNQETKRCPRYLPGDILWVRETWAVITSLADPFTSRGNAFSAGIDSSFWYKADKKKLPDSFTWRPSIHMPREAARLFLRVTDVRVERLQEINARDVMAEGIDLKGYDLEQIMKFRDCPEALSSMYRQSFLVLWDSLNAKRGYGWESNPWVWVYTFERCDKPQ